MSKDKLKTKIISVHPIHEVFEYIDASPKDGQRIRFRNHSIHMRSTKLLHFRTNGIKCVSCGKIGAFFRKEKREGISPYLQLYTFDKYG